MLSPIALFVYNRIDHTKKTIATLAKNQLAPKSILYIFSDAPKNDKAEAGVKAVREFIHSNEVKDAFLAVEIDEKPFNVGLAGSIIAGVSKVIEKHGKIIVIEDDNLSSPDFLAFMNDSLDYYKDNSFVWSIGASNIIDIRGEFPKSYDKDVYILQRICSYAWATWKDRWDATDWEMKQYKKKMLYNYKNRLKFNEYGSDRASMLDFQMANLISSWAIRFDYAEFINGKYTVYPSKTKTCNIGLDGSGVHNKARNDSPKVIEPQQNQYVLTDDLVIDPEIKEKFVANFKPRKKDLFKQYIKAYICRIRKNKGIIKTGVHE